MVRAWRKAKPTERGDKPEEPEAPLYESQEDRGRRGLAELISRRGGSINGRELVQSSRAYRTVDDANAALEDLANKGYGAWQIPEQCGPGGPKARRFVLADAANVYSNSAADSASGNSVGDCRQHNGAGKSGAKSDAATARKQPQGTAR